VQKQRPPVVAVAGIEDALVGLHIEAHALLLTQVEQRHPLPGLPAAARGLPQPQQVGAEPVVAQVGEQPLEVVTGLLGIPAGRADVLVGLAQGDTEFSGRLGVLRVLLLEAALRARLIYTDAEVLAGGKRCCGSGHPPSPGSLSPVSMATDRVT